MKKLILFIVFIVVVISAGAYVVTLSNTEPAPVPREVSGEEEGEMRIAEPDYSATYTCADEKSIYAGFSEGIVALALSDGREYTLEQTISASGARYANEGEEIVFFTKDYQAFLEEDGEMTFQNCVAEPDPSGVSLESKTWTWVLATYNDGTIVTPKQKDVFTISFEEGGKFGATTDCNTMGGEYSTSGGGSISFTNIAATKMYCESSQEDVFGRLLMDTVSYHISSEGELIFDLKFDSGSVIFE